MFDSDVRLNVCGFARGGAKPEDLSGDLSGHQFRRIVTLWDLSG
jgi:hypothetical protein